ncbi:MAG: hypothetical protein P8J50_10190 [Acidimicrobiales bacterium]|nr:hypothetical protein [Acidimicrobiales bacterium]
MSDDDPIAEQILDLFVYAPIGLALEARELLPKLADRGRGQVALTRLAGKVASDRGQTEVRKVLDQVVSIVSTVLAGEASDPPPLTDDPVVTPIGDDEDLPIDGYDMLSAPQLLPFLSPLTDGELTVVLDYEQQHRGRATVVTRIRQLQG